MLLWGIASLNLVCRFPGNAVLVTRRYSPFPFDFAITIPSQPETRGRGNVQQHKDSSVFHSPQLLHLPLFFDGVCFLASSFRGDTCSFSHDDIFVEATNDKRCSSLSASSLSSFY